MLVIISDLHITDESTAKNVRPEAFDVILGPRIITAAEKNSATEINITLLGDIFDLVRTDYWLKIHRGDRPWNGQLDPKTGMNINAAANEAHFGQILDKIFATDTSRRFIDLLKNLPAAAGRPVKVTYIIGNHDRCLNNYPSLVNKIKNQLPGMEVEFANVLHAPAYGVLARHGHEWDVQTHGWEFYNKVLADEDPKLHRFHKDSYKIMAIGEVITAELMAGLIYRFAENLPGESLENDKKLLENLKNVNNLRPMTNVFEWLVWLMQDAAVLPGSYKSILYSSLKEALSGVLDSTLAGEWDKMANDLIFWGDITDRLEKFRMILSVSNYDHLSFLVNAFEKMINEEEDYRKYSRGAMQEWEMEHGLDMTDIQYIVYGHTHRAERTYFSGSPQGKVKMYINTGTFLPLIQRTDDKKGFAMDHRLSTVFFYNRDEDFNGRSDEGPTLELWNGVKRKYYQ